jgi:sugar lactone lactonase YvrE
MSRFSNVSLSEIGIKQSTIGLYFGTLAGTPGSSGSTDGIGSAARFAEPDGIAVDTAGNVFVADTSNHTIRKITSAGVVTTFAGTAGVSGSTDGAGSAARFNAPFGLTADTAGNLFVTDNNNFTIRKVTSAGVVTTLAGLAGSSGSTDGTGSAARFNYSYGITTDTESNVFVADTDNFTIRKVTSAGVVTTLAGLAGSIGSTDGTGSAARFGNLFGLTTDTEGNLFVTDTSNNTIRKVTSAGVVTTLAGLAGSTGSADGAGSAARFNSPKGLAADTAGSLFVTDTNNCTIRKVTSAGVVTTIAGTSGVTGSANGFGSAARFQNASAIAVDTAGNPFVTDQFFQTIRNSFQTVTQ